MSLATRCTACGTIFRVVQDQLRVSEGFVRCGRCAEVFDAGEQLFDIDRDAPPPWPADAQPSRAEISPTPKSHRVDQGSAPSWQYPDESPPDPDEFAVSSAPAQTPPQGRPAEQAPQPLEPKPAFAPSRREPLWTESQAPEPAPGPPASVPPRAAESAITHLIDPPLEDDKPDVLLSKRLTSVLSEQAPAEPTAAASGEAEAEATLPEFMRKPASGSAWQRKRVRLAAGFACGVLIAALSVQLLHHFHDAIATVLPASRPVLQAYCQLSGCQIKPWQRIEHMAVESTALSQLSPGSNGKHYQLAISLRNKGPYELATPWVELSLTDSTGALVGRRILSPAEFSLSPPADKASPPLQSASAASAPGQTKSSGRHHESMAAGSELPLQVLLSTGQQGVSGYSVEIFYP